MHADSNEGERAEQHKQPKQDSTVAARVSWRMCCLCCLEGIDQQRLHDHIAVALLATRVSSSCCASGRRGKNITSAATLFVAVFFRMRFGRFGRMLRGLFMMPTGGMRMMRGFLVIPGLMVFGGFFVMPRGVLMLFRRLIVMLGCFGRHGKSP